MNANDKWFFISHWFQHCSYACVGTHTRTNSRSSAHFSLLIIPDLFAIPGLMVHVLVQSASLVPFASLVCSYRWRVTSCKQRTTYHRVIFHVLTGRSLNSVSNKALVLVLFFSRSVTWFVDECMFQTHLCHSKANPTTIIYGYVFIYPYCWSFSLSPVSHYHFSVSARSQIRM